MGLRELRMLAAAGDVTLLWRDWGVGFVLDAEAHPLAHSAWAIAQDDDEIGVPARTVQGEGALITDDVEMTAAVEVDGGSGGDAYDADEKEGGDVDGDGDNDGDGDGARERAGGDEVDPLTLSAAVAMGVDPHVYPLLSHLYTRATSATTLAVRRVGAASRLIHAASHESWQLACNAVCSRVPLEQETELTAGVASYLDGSGSGDALSSDLIKRVPKSLKDQLARDCAAVTARLRSMVLPAETEANLGAALFSLAARPPPGPPCAPRAPHMDPSAWRWATPVALAPLIAIREGGACGALGPPIPSPLVNAVSVTRVLQGLSSPLFGARDWRNGASGGEDGLWGRWAGWAFDDVLETAGRTVAGFKE